ncbi:unnamed protein product [Penicillium camemberti]|uniref:Str. FM013 n=1 Tax=Penicillium camemberti (strain FM 013) TaxID=1429867 RepID=A0A0G4P3R6_PENC3|nr:unnamed protein product [Penicillium camemberti]
MKGDDFRIQQLPDIYQPSWTYMPASHDLECGPLFVSTQRIQPYTSPDNSILELTYSNKTNYDLHIRQMKLSGQSSTWNLEKDRELRFSPPS